MASPQAQFTAPSPFSAQLQAKAPALISPQLPPLPQPSTSAALTSAAATVDFSINLQDHTLHKNRLQEYTQKSGIPLPVYQTVNEGSLRAPKFRSTVVVNGVCYTSPNTFPHRKAAEKDVARHAMEGITKKIKDEGCPMFHEDTVFCKSILNEFSMKMNLPLPTYNTSSQPGGLIPLFVSSLVFNGVVYTGDAGRSKKEAEQLAARSAILSLMGNSGSGPILSEIINSKFKLYAALHKVKNSHMYNGVVPVRAVVPVGVDVPVRDDVPVGAAVFVGSAVSVGAAVPVGANTRNNSVTSHSKSKEVVDLTVNNAPKVAVPASSIGTSPPHHEFIMPKQEMTSDVIKLPIAFVHPTSQEPNVDGPGDAKKRRKNKKKANKKPHTDTLSPSAAIPVTQTPPCSVAQ
ncbi:Double-stranded RNA-binding protein [Quillaja saponaria]|uniref:Double-stranded RNA-binding protein n=1 Tax=Quillaja saponaria TaxID=32244 RepID=A0AAD7LUG4_QUISA|nr:Double-stranded RNA-binding protein [Quillaja saponaria]